MASRSGESSDDDVVVIREIGGSIRPICRADFLDPYELYRAIIESTNYLVVDLRFKDDYKKFRIDCNSINIPPEDIDKDMTTIIQDRLRDDVELDMSAFRMLANWNTFDLIVLVDWQSSWQLTFREVSKLRAVMMEQQPYNGEMLRLPRIMILEGGLLRFARRYPIMIRTKPRLEHKPPSPTPIPAKRFKFSSPPNLDQNDSPSGSSYKTAIGTPEEPSLKVEMKDAQDSSDLRSAIARLLATIEMPSHIQTVLRCIGHTPSVDQALVAPKKLLNVIDRYLKDGPSDPHMFLRVFLKSMHFDLMIESEKKSPISDLFFGTMKHSLVCVTCGNASSKYEDFQTLTVPRNRDIWTEGFGLVDFISELMQERCVGFKCPKCGMPRRAIRRFGFSKLPQNIAIHVDRTRCNEGCENLTRIDFPFTRLNLDHYLVADSATVNRGLTSNHCYNLYAMVRIGSTISDQAFTAYYKSTADLRWSYYASGREISVRSKEIKRQKFDNYLLFYRRQLRS